MEPKRYLTLDGMRGVAAVMVVYGHTWGLVSPKCAVDCNVPSGSMTVDMFFVLSGFVISLSYDRKFAAGMSVWEFAKRRIIRLYPLYAIGFLIGAIPSFWNLLHGSGWHAIAIEFGLGALILPSPTWRFNASIIPILSPAWSLFAEFWVANLPFALFWKRLTIHVLFGIVAVSFVGLLLVIRHYGNTGVGALWSGVPGLFVRVGFSFSLGVILQRVHRRLSLPAFPGWLILLITAASFLARIHGSLYNIYEVTCLGLLYPALILLGAHDRGGSEWISKVLGDASYALYVIHIPVLMLIELNMNRLHLVQSQGLALAFVAAMVAVSIALAYYIDLPVRRWLSQSMLPSKQARAALV